MEQNRPTRFLITFYLVGIRFPFISPKDLFCMFDLKAGYMAILVVHRRGPRTSKTTNPAVGAQDCCIGAKECLVNRAGVPRACETSHLRNDSWFQT